MILEEGVSVFYHLLCRAEVLGKALSSGKTGRRYRETLIRQKTESNRLLPLEQFSDVPAGVSISPVELPSCRAWFVAGEDNPKDSVLLFVHGGGFVAGNSVRRSEFLYYAVTEWHVNVLSVDYRLAPEYRPPCQLQDCLDAYRFLLQHYAPERIVLLGESAGATLILSLLPKLRQEGLPMPGCAVANSPVAQIRRYTRSWFVNRKDEIVLPGDHEQSRLLYASRETLKDPLVWPLYGDYHDCCPVFLEVSDGERLYDDSVLLEKQLRKTGCAVTLNRRPDQMHAFLAFPRRIGTEEYHRAVRRYLAPYLD